MKKILVLLILAAGLGFFAYASMSNNKKQSSVKKTEKQEMKKECSRKCEMFG